EIESRIQESLLWIRGPHVFTDPADTWWCTEDRIGESPVGWWYRGRGFQSAGDFELEQRIYSYIRTSACFVHRRSDTDAHLIGEIPSTRTSEILKAFPELRSVRYSKIIRDRRHRAR